MSSKTAYKGKKKKPLKTTMGKALVTSEVEKVDLSHIRRPIETSLFGLRHALSLFDTSTEEVRNYITYECDIVYECKICRTLFRSLANFVLHKREYCRDKFNIINSTKDYLQEDMEIICDTPSETQNAPNTKNSSKCSTIKKYPKRNINSVLQNLSKKNECSKLVEEVLQDDISGELERNESENQFSGSGKKSVILEKIANCNVGVFQTFSHFELPQEFMKSESMEIHGILNTNEAVIDPNGKIIDFKMDKNVDSSNIPKQDLLCNICNVKFASKKTLTYHIKYKHNKTRMLYVCPECKDTFANAWGVFRHLYKIHRKTSTQIRKLREAVHSNVIIKSQNDSLNKKNSNVENRESINRENQWMNDFEGDNDLQMCGGCGKRFERKAALNSHSQLCMKRQAVCNSIKETNKRMGEQKSSKDKLNTNASANVRKGAARRKPTVVQKKNPFYSSKPLCSKADDANDDEKLPIEEVTNEGGTINEISAIECDINEPLVSDVKLEGNKCDGNISHEGNSIEEIQRDFSNNTNVDVELVKSKKRKLFTKANETPKKRTKYEYKCNDETVDENLEDERCDVKEDVPQENNEGMSNYPNMKNISNHYDPIKEKETCTKENTKEIIYKLEEMNTTESSEMITNTEHAIEDELTQDNDRNKSVDSVQLNEFEEEDEKKLAKSNFEGNSDCDILCAIDKPVTLHEHKEEIVDNYKERAKNETQEEVKNSKLEENSVSLLPDQNFNVSSDNSLDESQIEVVAIENESQVETSDTLEENVNEINIRRLSTELNHNITGLNDCEASKTYEGQCDETDPLAAEASQGEESKIEDDRLYQIISSDSGEDVTFGFSREIKSVIHFEETDNFEVEEVNESVEFVSASCTESCDSKKTEDVELADGSDVKDPCIACNDSFISTLCEDFESIYDLSKDSTKLNCDSQNTDGQRNIKQYISKKRSNALSNNHLCSNDGDKLIDSESLKNIPTDKLIDEVNEVVSINKCDNVESNVSLVNKICTNSEPEEECTLLQDFDNDLDFISNCSENFKNLFSTFDQNLPSVQLLTFSSFDEMEEVLDTHIENDAVTVLDVDGNMKNSDPILVTNPGDIRDTTELGGNVANDSAIFEEKIDNAMAEVIVIDDSSNESSVNGEISKDVDEITLEMKSVDYVNLDKLSCVPCDVSFATRKCLMSHMSLHFKWFRYQCRLCTFMSYDKQTCNVHTEVHNTHGTLVADNVVLPIPNWKTVSISTNFFTLNSKCDEVVQNSEVSLKDSEVPIEKCVENINNSICPKLNLLQPDEGLVKMQNINTELKQSAVITSDNHFKKLTVVTSATECNSTETGKDTLKDISSIDKTDPSLKEMIMKVIFGSQKTDPVLTNVVTNDRKRPVRNRTNIRTLQKDFVYDMTEVSRKINEKRVLPEAKVKPLKIVRNRDSNFKVVNQAKVNSKSKTVSKRH